MLAFLPSFWNFAMGKQRMPVRPACLLNGLLWVELLYRAEHARYQLSWEGEGRRKSAYRSSWALRHVFPLGSVGTPLCICCNKHCLEVQGAGSCEAFYEIFVSRVVLGTSIGNSVSAFLSPSTHVVRRYPGVLPRKREQGVEWRVPWGVTVINSLTR